MGRDRGESCGISIGFDLGNQGCNPFEKVLHQTYHDLDSLNVLIDLPGRANHRHSEHGFGRASSHYGLPEIEIHLGGRNESMLLHHHDHFPHRGALDRHSDRHSERHLDRHNHGRHDSWFESYGKDFAFFHDQLRQIKEELRELNEDLGYRPYSYSGDGSYSYSDADENYARLDKQARQKRMDSGRKENSLPRIDERINKHDGVITDTRSDKNGHYYVDGQQIALSQEEFKRHYGIPEEIDLLKFMPGKSNDGHVTSFWESPVSGGLGGRLENGNLKWDDPNYHTLKYDFSRNFAQVFQYSKGMNEEQAKEFAFNFARTQQAVFAANGFDLKKVENEKVYASGEGSEGWTDFVQDVGGKDSKINW